MKMVLADYYNQYHVNGKFVEDIVLYDDSGEVLQLSSSYIYGQWVSAVKEIPEVKEVASRRVVNLGRAEHFTCKVNNVHTLFLYLGAFQNVLVDNTAHRWSYPGEEVFSKSVTLDIGGQTYTVFSRLEKYITRKPTPEAPLIYAVQEYFNKEVADHSNRHLSVSATARLLDALPGLNEIVRKLGSGK